MSAAELTRSINRFLHEKACLLTHLVKYIHRTGDWARNIEAHCL